MKRKTINAGMYRGYSLINIEKNNKGFYTKILDTIIDMVETMCKKHNSVILTRIDIRSASDSDNPLNPIDITRALENVKRNFIYRHRESKNNPDFQHITKCERTDENSKFHYHLILLANGNAVRSWHEFIADLSKQISKRQNTDKQGLVHRAEICNKNDIILRRDSYDFKALKLRVIKTCSYLAKVYSTEYNTKWSKIYTCSRLTYNERLVLDDENNNIILSTILESPENLSDSKLHNNNNCRSNPYDKIYDYDTDNDDDKYYSDTLITELVFSGNFPELNYNLINSKTLNKYLSDKVFFIAEELGLDAEEISKAHYNKEYINLTNEELNEILYSLEHTEFGLQDDC